ncbi:type IV secretory system conjugative DNA transfer family protein [Acinetobacter soli]|uniref:type IV secretory system conjugative DNA transfer family protein n=1 Tax=Acinetobacter soli TaxID=487316 RepID=UPI001D189AFC|nr:type IV secretory system conjugative DNA transfer family protein [Acinetobacter soli]
MKDYDEANKRMPRWAVFIAALMVLAISLIILSSWATQEMAKIFGYHRQLGQPIYGHFYSPYKFLQWYMQYQVPTGHGLRPLLDKVVLKYVIIEGLIFLVVVLTCGFITNSRRKNQNIHGSAKWAEESELQQMGLAPPKGEKGEGVIVGGFRNKQGKLQYLKHDGPEHVIGIAPTRSGKGVGLVVPTLLSWKHSAIISDMKGELWLMTSGWRSKYANNICIKFDPASTEGSASFNPLGEIRLGTKYEISDTQNLVTILVDPEGKGLEDHWSKTAHALLTALVLYTLHYTKEKTLTIVDGQEKFRTASLGDVAYQISNPDQPIDDLWNAMLYQEYGVDRSGQPCTHPVIAAAAKDMQNTPDDERGSTISTARSFLTLYRDPIVEMNTSETDFTVSDLMDHEKPVSLYLVVRPGDKDRLKPLIRLMLTLILRVLVKDGMELDESGSAKAAHAHRLLMMLDEFPGFGRLKVFEDTLPYIAGYGIKAYLIAQDIEQLRASDAYGREETISANCHVRVVYAPNKIETAEWISKLSGTKTGHEEQISTSGNRFGAVTGHVNKSIHAFARPLLTPDEALRLKAPKKSPDGKKIIESGDMLVFVAGNNPVYGEQSLFFLDQVFLDRSKVKALNDTQVIRKRTLLNSEEPSEMSHVKDFSMSSKLIRTKGSSSGIDF